ncbi:MAG: GIY-YIG nuclease family protein [Candidatus Tectomicrobia bacterium]|uniref:GIY-YIG nuclease family protein n=1 Tax=Tectimicrobiota bacterium TaxID=2528274 RepID=A0A932CM46_UNCTE|nr:GIY-YIG nuclease family protein [Candidatus Tectomicrobia bacterium]
MRLEAEQEIQVGKLGRFAFPPGYYSYTGSAMGGLEARLARHRRRNKRCFWHIDYLLQWAQIVEIYPYPLAEKPGGRPTPSSPRSECRLNRIVLNHPRAQIPVPGFGSSDCHCPTHLLYYPGASPPCLEVVQQIREIFFGQARGRRTLNGREHWGELKEGFQDKGHDSCQHDPHHPFEEP